MMTDLDQIALDTVEAIANIDPDKLEGGRVQALAQAQCLVRDALQELEEVGAENYTLMQEVDAALEQVIYWRELAVAAEEECDAWRERAVAAEAERDALAALCEDAAAVLERTANDTLDGRNMALRLRKALDTTSLTRLKAEWQAEAVETAVARGYRSRDELAGWAEHLRRQSEEAS